MQFSTLNQIYDTAATLSILLPPLLVRDSEGKEREKYPGRAQSTTAAAHMWRRQQEQPVAATFAFPSQGRLLSRMVPVRRVLAFSVIIIINNSSFIIGHNFAGTKGTSYPRFNFMPLKKQKPTVVRNKQTVVKYAVTYFSVRTIVK